MKKSAQSHLCSLENFKLISCDKTYQSNLRFNSNPFTTRNRDLLEDVNSNLYLLEKDKSDLFLDKISTTEESIQKDMLPEKSKNKKLFYSFDQNQLKNKNQSDNDSFLSDENDSMNEKEELENVFNFGQHKLFDDNLFECTYNENQESTSLKKRNYVEYKESDELHKIKTLSSYNIENKLNYFHDNSKYNKEISNTEKKTLINENTNSTISDLSKKNSDEKLLDSEKNHIILTNKEKSKIKKISLFWKNKTKLIPNVFRNLKKSCSEHLFLFEKQDLSHKEVLGKYFI